MDIFPRSETGFRVGAGTGPDVAQASDGDLIARWQAGDAAAFERLVARWQQPVARFLTHYAGEPSQVEDLCQEVFLRVYLARDRYRASGAFSTWIYRIALNVARDAARRSRLRRCRPLDEIEAADVRDRAADTCERRETGAAVAAALADLPDALRLVVVLRHYERLSFAEMSRLLGTPESTLKSRFAVALARLRARLRELGCEPEENEP